MGTRVLYVDDEPAMLELVKEFLRRDPEFVVECASGAAEAFEKLDGGGFDAVVSDYQMPVTDGIEFLKGLRAGGSEIPFIIFTGKGREDVAMEALNEGADFYLQKGGQPVAQFAELGHMIKRAVSQRRKDIKIHDTTQRLDAVIQSSPNPIYAMDLKGTITAWNPAAERVFGWKVREVVGKPSPIIPEHDRERFIETIKGLASENEGFSTMQVRRRRKDGTLIDVHLSVAPMSDRKGEVIGFMANAVDLTDRMRMERDLLRLNRMYAFLSSVNTSIVRDNTMEGLMEGICTGAVSKAGFSACGIGIVEGEEVECAWVDLGSGPAEFQNGSNGLREMLTRMSQRAVQEKTLVWERYREQRGNHHGGKPVRAVACKPIVRVGDGTYVLWLCSDDPDFFEEKERMFLDEVAMDIAFALRRMEGAQA